MADVAADGSGDGLSACVRTATAPLHARIEALAGLPDAVRDRQDYRRLLECLFGLYEPLERSFQRLGDWEGLGLDLSERNHACRLSRDLAALGTDVPGLPRAGPGRLPDLPAFPHALGAFYVLEGSTLGGRIILRALDSRLGPQIAGATRFLAGHGGATGPMWIAFRTALDGFGRVRPDACDAVLSGAERTYGAILSWFAQDRAAGAVQS